MLICILFGMSAVKTILIDSDSFSNTKKIMAQLLIHLQHRAQGHRIQDEILWSVFSPGFGKQFG